MYVRRQLERHDPGSPGHWQQWPSTALAVCGRMPARWTLPLAVTVQWLYGSNVSACHAGDTPPKLPGRRLRRRSKVPALLRRRLGCLTALAMRIMTALFQLRSINSTIIKTPVPPSADGMNSETLKKKLMEGVAVEKLHNDSDASQEHSVVTRKKALLVSVAGSPRE
jgi:hypothetical protein